MTTAQYCVVLLLWSSVAAFMWGRLRERGQMQERLKDALANGRMSTEEFDAAFWVVHGKNWDGETTKYG